MATINMHMKFEIEIPQETWLMLRKPCRLQTDGRTDRRTDKVNPVYPTPTPTPTPPPPTLLGGGIKILLGWLRMYPDTMTRKRFPHHCPFVRGIHRSPVVPITKGQECGMLVFSLSQDKLLSKRWSYRIFETLLCTYDITVIIYTYTHLRCAYMQPLVVSCDSFTHTQDNLWWRLPMETFSALLAICAGNAPVVQ